MKVQLHSFLNSAPDGGDGYAPATLTTVQNSSTHWRGGWVGPRAGPDVSEDRNIYFPCMDSGQSSP